MAVLDSSEPMVYSGAAAIQLSDGTGTPLTVDIIFEGTFSWTRTGRTITEARTRGRRKATPVLIEGEDNDITISLSGKITSYLGDSNTHIYEALHKDGNASAWVKTGAGNAHSFDLIFTALAPDSGGTTQTLRFSPCTMSSFNGSPDGEGNMHEFEAELVCYANDPTIA